jgi:hypothetical protein
VYGAAALRAYWAGVACSICPSFSVWLCGEASHKLGVQSADVSALPGVLPQSSMSPASCQSPWITEVRRSVVVFWSPSWTHLFLMVLEFELRVVCLLGTCSATGATPSALQDSLYCFNLIVRIASCRSV